MNLIEILILAVVLSIDACVVSFLYGLKQQNNFMKSSLLLACFTGLFQGLMPLISTICTNCVKYYIEPFSKWIIFAIFLYLGFNFIKESFEKARNVKDLSLKVLFMIAIATSIDAFSVGIPLSLKVSSLWSPIFIISIITFINSIFGFLCGRFFAGLQLKYLEILGGVILIVFALKVVL